MKTINLRDYYYWYTHDNFVDVPDEVAAALDKDKSYENVHDRRMRRNKTYSYDVESDIESAAYASFNDNPESLV